MTQDSEWPVTFEANRVDQARRWAAASAAQRLRWLEDAVRIALRSGALAPDAPAPPPAPPKDR